MKRFLLFAGMQYYPRGGWNDFRGDFDTLEDALAAPRNDWWHIVDTVERRIVKFGYEE